MNNDELILITNDDGYKARGLKVLNYVARKLSNNIWSFAPSLNNSGKSHSITINKKTKVKYIGSQKFHVDGTPVDCVIVAKKYLSLKNLKPNLILSGINYGQNLGFDIFYSGTFAAAREASIQGIKAFSISLEKNKKSSNWQTVKYFLPKILNNIKKLDIKPSIYFNINFPNVKINSIKGCKVVKLGKRKPGEHLEIINTNKNSFFFKIPSERKIHSSASINEDEYEMKKNFITITYHCSLDFNERLLSKKITESIGKIIE